MDVMRLVTKGLNRNERLIIILYYYEELTMKDIGNTLGLSESRVSQMHSSIVARLKEQLERRRPEFGWSNSDPKNESRIRPTQVFFVGRFSFQSSWRCCFLSVQKNSLKPVCPAVSASHCPRRIMTFHDVKRDSVTNWEPVLSEARWPTTIHITAIARRPEGACLE